MEIKYRQYPYPVLIPDGDDYKNCYFRGTVEDIQEGTDFILNFTSELECHSLSELIKKGKAKFAYHLECTTTGFRTVHQTADKSSRVVIPSNKLRGKLQISPFILATTDLVNYSASDFDDDYLGETFDIEEGCILAAGITIEKSIRKKIDELANTPSIFSISLNPDRKAQNMVVDLGREKICIWLTEKDKSNYKALFTNPQLRPAINSIVLLPALVYALSHVQKAVAENDSESYDNSLWFKTVESVLRDRFGISIEKDLPHQDVIVLAQKLLSHPIESSLETLSKTLSEVEEEL